MSSDAEINVQMYNELKKVEGEQIKERLQIIADMQAVLFLFI